MLWLARPLWITLNLWLAHLHCSSSTSFGSHSAVIFNRINGSLTFRGFLCSSDSHEQHGVLLRLGSHVQVGVLTCAGSLSVNGFRRVYGPLSDREVSPLARLAPRICFYLKRWLAHLPWISHRQRLALYCWVSPRPWLALGF